MVATACELVDRLEFLAVGAPHLFINPRCAVSLVIAHSFDGQKFGRTRVGEQPLQSSRFAVAVFSDCLCNTHLQSSDRSPDFVPAKRLPIAALGGGRTNRSVKINRPILLQRMTRSTWAYPGHYRPALACSILSMPSPLGLPCGWLALEQPRRENSKRLFHVPDLSRDGLGPLCAPAVRHSRRATFESPNLTAYLLVQALISLVWLVLCDDACECLII